MCLCIYIIVIILSSHQHRYPWPSLATPPYHSWLLAGPQGYIPYDHWAAVCRFELVVLLLFSHMMGPIYIYKCVLVGCFSFMAYPLYIYIDRERKRQIVKKQKDMYIYLPNPSARAEYDIRSIFKQSFPGLNLEFSFS